MKMKSSKMLVLVASACAAPLLASQETADAAAPDAVYVAELHSLNNEVTGSEATGDVRFTISEDTLTIDVDAQGLPPGIMHLQHFHGFTEGGDASCATPAADTNDDGIIDLIETEPVSGTTMVPFTADPVSMKIVTDTYPTASAEGTYRYEQSVSLEALQTAFAEAFGGQELDLDSRVVYIHGVLPSTDLSGSVASLGDIPAQVTLPIACGEIRQVAE